MRVLRALFRLHSRVGDEPAVWVPSGSCASYHVSTEASLKLAGGAVLLFGVTTNPARADGAQVGGRDLSVLVRVDWMVQQHTRMDAVLTFRGPPHMAVATAGCPQLPRRQSSQ